MSLITNEEQTDDIFNYTDPEYIEQLNERVLSESLRSSNIIVYCDPTEFQNQLSIHYEPAYKPLVAWQHKAASHRRSLHVTWEKFLAPPTPTVDALVGSPVELAELLHKINDLAFEEEEDQFGPIRPTFHAFKHCMKLILEIAADGKLFRPSDITTDHNGDIRISWTKGNREAELVCPSDDRPYIYYSNEQAYGTDEDLTADKISERVRWALEGK